MSRSSRIGDSRKDNTNTISTFSMKRPSPLNVWSPSTEKSKISARSKSPANVWTALSDKSDETEPNPTCDDDNGKTRVAVDHKPIVLQATTTTLSSDKPMKPDIVYGSDTLLEQRGHVGSNDTNDDGTTVSGVTNPSFFPEDKPSKKNTFHDRSTSFLSKSGEESFNVNSPVFTSGRMSGRIAPSPRDKASSALPALSDDDFSDPFFPNGTEDVTKEESGVSEAPDPDIDHVGIGTDNESDDNNHALIGSRKDRHKRFIVRKAVVARSNESKAKKQVDDPKSHPVQLNKAVTTGTIDSVTQNIIDHRNSVLSRRDRKNATATVSIRAKETEAKPAFVPPRTMVSERISEMEKPTPSAQSFKRGSPYRRGHLRHREPTGIDAKKQVSVETQKAIQTSSNIPPIVGRRGKINPVQDRSLAVLAKSSSESTIAAEPTTDIKSFSSNEEVGHHSVKRLGRSGDLSISSVGSDIQRLRSILRRSRIQGNGDNVRYIEPLESAFATYDEQQIKDPMQRAGLRLLSAAVVPIQSAVRRHLAFRSALTRMWAIVTIQAATRRWLVRYDDFRWATIKLQALHRGSRVRDQILLEHCCAIEIQRHVRGLIASWYVYDEIYKIKLVQACVRRKLAMERAMDRMVSIIQIQSIGRGFLLRMRQKRLITAVTKVQSAWRAFTCRFTYQLDILDIIIMQSVWRKKIAQLKFARLQHEHQIRCAVKIQSQWRSYDCSMNYLHFIADVLITQSVVRRYLAIRRCIQIRNNNALVMQKAVRSFLARIFVKRIRSVILIQSAYRGFVCYADYMFTISDIVLAQSVARRWLKQKDYPQKLHDHKSKAAVVIQNRWRGFSQLTDYYVMRQENKSAIAIQSAWRRFFHFSIYIVVIDSAIRIQSSCRGFLVREKLAWHSHAALTIQCAYRVLSAKKNLSRALAAQELFSSSKDIAIQQRQAVTNIQRMIRGAQVRDAVGLYTRTRIFQSAWRGYRARKLYCQHVYARRIQSIWRRHVAVADFDIYRKARTVQSAWRRYLALSTFALYIKVRSIQKVWRGYEKRSAYKIYLKSRLIQATWRAYAARTSYLIFVQARMIQLAWRKHLAITTLHKHHAAKRTQAIWRGYVVRTTVALYVQARSIQAAWRGYLVRVPYKEYIACRRIQSCWRRRMAVQCLICHIKARRVQTWWRCNSQRAIFETHKANVAATHIQASWRCKSVSSAYKSFLAARRIQTAWRGTSISRAYKHFMNVRLVQALWRGRVVRNAYRQHNSARNIQALWRGRTIHIAYRQYVAARRIQTMWRGQSICKAYTKYRCACHIQSVWRGRLISRAYKEYLMARRIQTFWRCNSLCNAHNKYKKDRCVRYTAFYSVCKIQALWRRKSLETAFKQYLAVVRIQSFWRATSAYNAYEFYRTDRSNRRVLYKAARTIQSNWRSKALSYTYKLFKTSLSARYVHNSSALRIQTSWRAASLHKAFAQFIAARNIQASWRRKLIQSAYLQFMACRRIQASWRGKQVRTAYKQFIDTRQMQDSYYKKLFAKDSPQVADVGLLRLNPRKSIKHVAATKIAAAWRGFSTCQRYWHVLGSVIEIQTIVRGWLARRKLNVLQENALVQLRTINAIKYRSIARSRNSRLQANDRNEKNRTDKAARTIQRFFSMVKAEVDREIRAEKKRRKVKKRAKKNRGSFDEKLLESVWRKTIEDDLKYLDYKRSMKASVAASQVEKKRVPKLITKGSEDSRLSTGREMMSLCGTPMSASGRLGVVPLSVNSFKFDADDTSKSALKRSSKSRLNSMSPREIDEDFLLEEAWIDSKIISAKERRGAHRIIGPSQLVRPSSSKARSVDASEYKLPPTMPVQARRPTIDSSSDRRPPRRTQAV
jgi:IQ calmodulin-binding motif